MVDCTGSYVPFWEMICWVNCPLPTRTPAVVLACSEPSQQTRRAKSGEYIFLGRLSLSPRRRRRTTARNDGFILMSFGHSFLSFAAKRYISIVNKKEVIYRHSLQQHEVVHQAHNSRSSTSYYVRNDLFYTILQ